MSKIGEVGKIVPAEELEVSKRDLDYFKTLRSIPQELTFMSKAELDGDKVTVIMAVDLNSDDVFPLAVLVDEKIFDRLVPLYTKEGDAALEELRAKHNEKSETGNEVSDPKDDF